MLIGFLDNLFYFYKTADDIISMYKVKNTGLLGVQENKKRLFEIRQRFINNEFIHKHHLDYIQSSYNDLGNIALILETRFTEYEILYNDLLEYKKKSEQYYDYFEYYETKYNGLSKEYLEFIEWACLREGLVFPYDYYFYIEGYKLAKEDYIRLSYYLKCMPTHKYAYFYNLALHNIVCSPDSKNDLYTKYKINLSAIGFANSVSDSVSSVSLNVPNWINDASISDSILTQTPYGLEVLKIRTQLNNLVVCV